jgi:metal-responsive CopG/Arc/MetJ family transcriptional regulator
MPRSRKTAYTESMPRTTKVSVSLPNSLLARADAVLGRPGEGRSALFARVLDEAVRAAEEAEIDAEYERAYAEHPITDDENRVHEAMLRLSTEAIGEDMTSRNG